MRLAVVCVRRSFMQLTTNLLIGSIAAIEIGSAIVVRKLIRRRSRIIVE